MNSSVASALSFCAARAIDRFSLIVPFPLSDEEIAALREDPRIRRLFVLPPSDGALPHVGPWLQNYDPTRSWRALWHVVGPILFASGHALLPQAFLWRAVRAGRWRLVCRCPGGFRAVSVFRLLAWQSVARVLAYLRPLPDSHPLVRAVHWARRRAPLRALWSHLVGPGPQAAADEAPFPAVLRAAPAPRTAEAVPRRVVLVNVGLGAGGAERQIVNTLIGLKRKGLGEVSFLGEYLGRARAYDFHRDKLVGAGIPADPLPRRIRLHRAGAAALPPNMVDPLSRLPPDLLEEVLNLAEEFRRRRPEVVHAWQDGTSIRAGLAAVIAGVPRILLSGRNVSPNHFPSCAPHMKAAYRALVEAPAVVLVNNSAAGARTYAEWLGIERERLRVLRNGVDLAELARLSDRQTRPLHQRLTLPAGAPIVGSVFRLWPAKRPLLWIDCAARIAERFPRAHFVILGAGPLRARMAAHAARVGLRGRFHLLGERADAPAFMRAFDVFLLTSEFEGIPNAQLEAQALGVPVVATDAGGVGEGLCPGATGWVVKEPTPEAVAAEVRALLGDPGRRERARAAGPGFIRARFAVESMIEATLKLYRFPDLSPQA